MRVVFASGEGADFVCEVDGDGKVSGVTFSNARSDQGVGTTLDVSLP